MIIACTAPGSRQIVASNGRFSLAADTMPPKGSGDGFRPHELLEAALASCMALTARQVADDRGLPLESIEVNVSLDRTKDETPVFRTNVTLTGPLADEDRALLLAALKRCPVRKTLAKTLVFDEVDAEQ
ncbi:OsmC family protein [Telmatospirillum sp.]|uniref:OsmC family protein n=1 Tax=Telmatospirillum sp. TaxID=2079197 RepID=UPI002840AC2F|nr:OsmC family protein [Telmatospirillum sp.]MDR3436059.1 OsmC family protein [Telmatospirillum sp.]